MMRRSARDRLIGAGGSAAIVLLLGYALLAGLSVRISFHGERSLPLVVVDLPQPKPPRPIKDIRRQHDPAPNAPSPRNLKNEATQIVAPAPVILLPIAPPVVAAAKPGEGAAATSGASDIAGPGEGAGGSGNGSGGGGSGDGEGDRPPRHLSGRLRYSDLPSTLREAGIGGTVSVRYDVEVDGRVTGCVVPVSSGIAELDRLTCQLIEQRFRFKPSRDADGTPVRSTIEESHSWEVPTPADPVTRR